MAVWDVVEARAPGKVIISGEHAVVHGTAAVAAALNLYTVVRISRPAAPILENAEFLSLNLPDLQLRLKWRLQLLKESLDFQLTEVDPLVSTQMDRVKAIVEDFVKREVPPNVESGARDGIKAFFVLYLSILGLQPLDVFITSELPVGAGLGSSAAFCVAASGALLTVAAKVKLQVDELKTRWMDLDDKGRDLVNLWAFEGEKIIHGKPSGVDNNVSCYGHVVRFKKGSLTRLKDPMQVRMLITNTKVGRNTKALVAGVGERTKRHPTAMSAVFQAVEAICEEFVSILESSESGAQEITRLEELMTMNQSLLECMGVSHPSIQSICQTTSRFNLSSKLTGAGGGGCVLTLLPREPRGTTIQDVKSLLEASGYQCFESDIGGKGLQISCTGSL